MLTYKQELQLGKEFTGKLPFKPIIIEKKPPQPKKSVSKKILMKTIDSNKIAKISQGKSQDKRSKIQQQWYQGGKLTGLFDNKLRKNQLTQQQRRIRNKSRENKQMREQSIKQIQKKRLSATQKNFNSKTHNEIEHLKILIEKQKQQKKKNDRLFQQQQRKLEKQRQQLKLIQQQIKKMGPGKIKPKTQIINEVIPNNQIPTHDKCKVQYKTVSSKYPQITQTQEIIRQKNQVRQKQLQRLMVKKDKLQNYNNPLNYTPTLIPLLSKASYKIISTHISTLTELLVDQLLLQQILVLQQIEEKEHQKKKLRKQKQVISDYMELVGQLVRENDQIQYRVGKYDKIQLGNWYKKDLYNTFQKIDDRQIIQKNEDIVLSIDQNFKRSTEKYKLKFINFTKYRDQYDVNNFKMFGDATQQIIDEILNKMIQQLDKGSGEFVETIFKNQFK